MQETLSHTSPPYTPAPIFTELGEEYSDAVEPARFPKHILRYRNSYWAERVGLSELTPEQWERHFALFEPLKENFPRPLALRYHGHQFRSYNPDLGDGRGFLFAQLRDGNDGRVLDLGTKGSGQTPYSRRGDGRLTLKGAVREALATEMLESLGVYTSKTFSIFETGEQLERYDEPSPTRSAVLVRLSHSHIRFGTFQRLAFLSENEKMKRLIDYCLRHYFRHLGTLGEAERPAAFLSEVVRRSADLCAEWMIAGFVHGVLNSDNMNITGESFDYGPYRFLPIYSPDFTAAYFDQTGLYAYGRQPESVLWNLQQLASSLTLVGEVGPLEQALNEYAPRFNSQLIRKFIERLGLQEMSAEADSDLFVAAFHLMKTNDIYFEQFFFDWYGGLTRESHALIGPESQKYRGPAFDHFRKNLAPRTATESAKRHLTHAYFTRRSPCALLIDEIEWIWDAIAQNDDWSRFEQKIIDIRLMGQVYERRQS